MSARGRGGWVEHERLIDRTSRLGYVAVLCLVVGHANDQTFASSLEQSQAYRLCSRVHRLWVLLVSLQRLVEKDGEISWLIAVQSCYDSAIMKLYAMCTLHETGWGTRAGISDRESCSIVFRSVTRAGPA